MKIKEFFCTLPSYLWLVLFFLIPTFMVFAFALKPYDPVEGVGTGWTLNTLVTVITESHGTLLWRTVWLAAVTTLCCLLISLPVGYWLIRATPRMQKLFLLLVIMPFWSSFLVRVFAWKTILHPEGILTNSFVFLHIIEPDTLLLYSVGAVLIVMIYSYLPFALLPIYTQSVKFNYSLIEAAMDLGASQLKAFFSVFLPSIRKGIYTAAVCVFIPSIGAYVIPDLVGGTQSEMIGNAVAQKIFIEKNLPQASALSAILCAIILLPLAAAYYLQRGRR